MDELIERLRPIKVIDRLVLIGFIMMIASFIFSRTYDRILFIGGFTIAIIYIIIPDKNFETIKQEWLYICGIVLFILLVGIGIYLL